VVIWQTANVSDGYTIIIIIIILTVLNIRRHPRRARSAQIALIILDLFAGVPANDDATTSPRVRPDLHVCVCVYAYAFFPKNQSTRKRIERSQVDCVYERDVRRTDPTISGSGRHSRCLSSVKRFRSGWREVCSVRGPKFTFVSFRDG